MCQILSIQRSGFYAWLKQPKSARASEDERLLGLKVVVSMVTARFKVLYGT